MLLPPSRCNAHILFGQVEIVGVGILQARLVARLPGEPVKQPLDVREGGIQCCLVELLPGPLPHLLGQMPLERDGLLEVKRLEVTVFGIRLESRQSLRDRVHRWLAVALGFLHIGEVAALDPFVVRVVRCHGLVLPIPSHCSRRARRSRLCVRVLLRTSRERSRLIRP